MRTLTIVGSILVFSLSALAQHGGNRDGGHSFIRPMPSPPSSAFGSGFGRIAYPGTGRPPTIGNGVTFPYVTPPTTFVERFGASINGGGYTGGHGRWGHGRRGGGAAFPIAYPVYVGGEYYSDPAYYQQEQQTPNITIVMPPQQNTPPVTVNQYPAETRPAQPTMQTYESPSAPRPEPADDQVVFYVALKDSSVYTALAYWVEDATLHYINSQGKHNQVSLDLVDRETSSKLNEGRKVEFRLPPSR